jgi:flavodoxin
MTKVLVAFYSRTGRTRRVAEDLASHLHADLEEIIDKKNRKGLLGFLRAGRDAMKGIPAEIAAPAKDPANYDLVLVGTPIWGGRITPAVRTYLDSGKTSLKDFAFFLTSGNTASESVLPAVRELAGKEPRAHTSFTDQDLKDKGAYEKKMGAFLFSLPK